ncbi:YfhO family protein [Candidatus Curtissbacteria bacterium]|nr:YfhO family protein [Candidatus Curtissbacteria bacterium]
MNKSPKTPLVVFTIFTFLTLILFWPIFLGKVNLNGNLLVSFYAPYGENLPYKNSGLDQLRIYFPFYKITLDSIKNFEIPLWSPYAFSGHPHMADFQTAVFYPLNIFGFFLSQISFWHFLRITPTILAAFFTFLYLQNLKLSKLASLFGAITFGFSPFILTWGEEVVMSPHSIVWLPLILYAIEKYLVAPNKRFLVLISLGIAFSLFGGYIQTSIYMVAFVLSYLIFRLWGRGISAVFKNWKLALAFVLGFSTASIQLLPSAELYFNSARSLVTLKEKLFEFLLPPEAILTYLAPDFFGHPATWNFFRGGSAQYYEGLLFVGIAALIFAVYAIFYEAKNRLVVFLAIFALITTSTTFDLPTSRLLLSLPIPFLSSSIANRVLFIPAFCLSALAAFGVEKWIQSQNKSILKVLACFAFLYAVCVFYLIGVKIFNFPYFQIISTITPQQNALVSLRNLVIPLVVFVLSGFLIFTGSLSRNMRKLAVIFVIFVSFVHVFYFAQKYFSFSLRENVFPTNSILEFVAKNQGFYRSWGVDGAFLENNFATQYRIFWPEGYDSLNDRSYGEFTHWMQNGKVAPYTFRADAGLGRVSTSEALESTSRRKLIDMVGVKYVIAKKEDFEELGKHNFKKVSEPASPVDSADQGFAVFENLQVMSRVFLASHYEGPPPYYQENLTEEEIDKIRRPKIIEKLLAADFDFRSTVILEKPSPISPQYGPGSAEIVSYQPQEVIIKTKSDQPKILFLSDNYYPGWKAQVDGDETKILRANYTFRAVPLIPGEHTVRFYYDSDVFKVGLLISGLSLAFLVYLARFKNLLWG